MPDYSNSKIYKLVCPHADDIYIGSTTQKLCSRFALHNSKYRSFMNNKHHFVSSFIIMSLGDVRIILLEDFPCENKEQLRAKEQEYIEKHKDICVNIYGAVLDVEKQRKYSYNYNRSEKGKKRSHKSNEKRKEKGYYKSYYKKNKQIISSKRSEEKLTCECGSTVTKHNISVHRKTKKHLLSTQ